MPSKISNLLIPEIEADSNELDNPILSIAFDPLPGFKSPHLQTVLACFAPAGAPPPSEPKIIPLSDGDALYCEISTPPLWKDSHKTIILLHGLGGCHTASYMIRLSRKLYYNGYRAIRLNMRSCGRGKEFASLPYHGGLSSDIRRVIEYFKEENQNSPITLIGYSLGGNIALKLAAEFGQENIDLIEKTIAICPPVDLAETAKTMAKPMNRLYNRYYMRNLGKITKKWTEGRVFSNIYEFDKYVTAPKWGFENPDDYYKQSSSCYKLDMIRHPCHILIAADDPFINPEPCLKAKRSSSVKIWVSKYGGHMGFFADKNHGYFWLDKILLRWISNT